MLSSYVRLHQGDYRFVVEGPALRIFQSKLGILESDPLHEAVERCDSVLCGSSATASLELDAIAHARALGKHAVVYLDHWINYRKRFRRGASEILPDAIWVGDIYAEREAKTQFPGLPVVLKGNSYLDEMTREIRALPARAGAGQRMSVLFVSQPIREHARNALYEDLDRKYFEDEALRYLMDNMECVGGLVERLAIRLHPAEPADKYDWLLRESAFPVEVDRKSSLSASIAAADVVVGMDSMAMVVALYAGKRVICCIPPGGKPCRLPHSDIDLLQDLVARS
ncbi:hypothetical protein [Litorivivens sp.]|uniref:hypothetical protein n=1 Tax=Litorivivens sp. TaxID=2020868 RepID=UPI0035612B17